MSRTFLIGDTHFGHSNILKFKKADDTLLRPGFSSIEEHDAFLEECWNKTVSPKDKVYHLGDVGFTSFSKLSKILGRLNGTKVLIKGNHDNFKLSQYAQHFKDVRACHTLDNFLLTHIPVHTDSVKRWKANIHGHLHAGQIWMTDNNLVWKDPRYINVSCEQINYIPKDFEEIRSTWTI